jgi:SAM-dependent methyltransferase
LTRPEADFLRDTRVSYDRIADDYARLIIGELAARPFDRAMLAAFAELVDGSVADIGCGPGRVTAHLASLGVSAFGVDLSPAMIAAARRTYPDLRFEVDSMTDLSVPDGSLGGIVAWYSIIHVPTELLPEVFAGFHRALVSGGHLLLAFQVGDEVRHRTSAAGHEISLDFHRRQPHRVAQLLRQAGFAVQATLVREPRRVVAQLIEQVPQAFLLAEKRQGLPGNEIDAGD